MTFWAFPSLRKVFIRLLYYSFSNRSISCRFSSNIRTAAVLETVSALVDLSHPDGGLSSVWLLQAEDLCHHVVGGGMQQDSARGQADHHIAAHRRQANRDSIWTCARKVNIKTLIGYITQERWISVQ